MRLHRHESSQPIKNSHVTRCKRDRIAFLYQETNEFIVESMAFNTVEEITGWRHFSFNSQTYDLSHLNAHVVEYLDFRNPSKQKSYRFIVTYGSHCFTEDLEKLSREEAQMLMYQAPKENRPFNFERYELSKQLPDIIKSLGEKSTLVFHGGYGKFATIKVIDSNGDEIDYFVPFAVFREKKKLRLHVQSAYPKYERMGKVKKVGFFVIANNLLGGRALPKPF